MIQNHLQPDKSVVVSYSGDTTVRLLLDMGVGIGGDKWPAADQFCHLIVCETWRSFFANMFHDKTIIDLGSGTGLTGIMIAKYFQPKNVIITDQESHIAHIALNVAINDLCQTEVIPYDWLDPPVGFKKGDVVLAFEW